MAPVDASDLTAYVDRLRDQRSPSSEAASRSGPGGHGGDEAGHHSEQDPVFALLTTYHTAAVACYEPLIRETLSPTGSLREAIDAWPGRIGIDPPEGVDRVSLVATFHPLLLAAEAVLLTVSGERRPVKETDTSEDYVRRVSQRARAAFSERALAPPVTSGSAPFAHIPENQETSQLLQDLQRGLRATTPIGEVSRYLGQLYEHGLSLTARKPAGEFFTDGRIARAVAKWAIPDPSERVTTTNPLRILDPAAGSGRFLDAAATTLSDQDREGMVIGVDVNPITLHAAAVTHAIRDSSIEQETRHASFFSISPLADDPQHGPNAAGNENAPRTASLQPVDAIIGNPPFVRSEDLPLPRRHYRDHLDECTCGDNAASRLSRRADLSAYFLTHASRFLREGSRLGFVVPNKWLSAAYAADLRSFLFSNFAVHAIVGFGQRAFDEALVDAVIVLGERCSTSRERARTPVRFVQVDAPVGEEQLHGILTADREPPGTGTAPHLSRGRYGRTVTLPQAHLQERDPAKLTPYLTAPDALLSILDDPTLCPLRELASVSRGVTTGANDFFFLSPEEARNRPIDRRFLHRAQKSIRGVETPVLEPAEAGHWIVDVHDYVTERAERSNEPVSAEAVRRTLERDGYDSLATYIAQAETEGYDSGRTCNRRPVWFDLGDLPTPDIFLPKLLRERVFPIRNRAEAVPSNAIDCLTARKEVDPDLLHGVLLSTLVQAIMEVWGRDEAGMLQLMTYETKTLPVPDVRRFTEKQRSAIRAAAHRVSADPSDDEARRELDDAMATALRRDGLFAPDTVRALRDRIRGRRLDRGDAVAVLVSDGD